MKNFLGDESGNFLILTAIYMSVLVGFLGMGIDVGMLYRARQRVQIAADAAAVAAAIENEYNGPSDAITVGKAASATNGFTDDSNGVEVTVNTPPSSGPALGAGFYEAIVKTPNSTMFMRALGFPNIDVAARAVAGTIYGDGCIWLMAKSGVGLNVQGSYVIDAPNCGIYVNSTSSNAMNVTGNSGTIDSKYILVVGGSVGHQTTPTPITTNSAPETNPWANEPEPSTSSCTTSNTYAGTTFTSASHLPAPVNNVICFSNSVTFSGTIGSSAASTTPGDLNAPYAGGAPAAGSLPGLPCTGSFVCASQGITYIFEGNLNIATSANVTFGSATINGSGMNETFSNTYGAMIDLACNTCTINQGSNSLLSIYGPTAGNYNGIAIYQPSTNSTALQVQFGSNNQVLDGFIFAPAAQVYMQDSGGGVTASGIVADTMYEQTSQLYIPLNYNKANPATTMIKRVVLVE